MHLLRKRRFLPLFVTQFLGAFNDNLFKTAMVILVTYYVYSDPTKEAVFNAISGAVFILPFFLFSSGRAARRFQRQGADHPHRQDRRDRDHDLRRGRPAGPQHHSLMLIALFAMGVHSSFFGPIKYAVLPQHLQKDEVLAGTGLVEAGTYVAILMGTIAGGLVKPPAPRPGCFWSRLRDGSPGARCRRRRPSPTLPWRRWTGTSSEPRSPGQRDPPHPAAVPRHRLDQLLLDDGRDPRRAIPASGQERVQRQRAGGDSLPRHLLGRRGLGSVLINRLLKGRVAAVYSPASAIAMGLFICHLYWNARGWPAAGGELIDVRTFVVIPRPNG
jgi:hypothetical protein